MKIYKIIHCGICSPIEPKNIVQKIADEYPKSKPEIKKLKPNNLECVYTPDLIKGVILEKEPFIEDIPFNIHSYSFEVGHTTFLVEMNINNSKLDLFEGTDFFNFSAQLKIDDKSFENTFFGLILEFMNKTYSLQDIVKLIENSSLIDPKFVEKLQNELLTKFGIDAYICGGGLGIEGYVVNNNITIIVGENFDESEEGWENIGQNKFQLFENKAKSILNLYNNELEDQEAFLEEFIQKQFIDGAHYGFRVLIMDWLSSIKSEAKNIRKNIPIQNKVFWRNYREKIEAWELYFLELQTDLFTYTSQFEFFTFNCFNENYINKWKTEFLPKKEALFRNTEMARTGIENLATPGKTHDEHSLQLETEKVNERMLMLSFFAVSIPLFGAIIAPGIAPLFKVYAAIFLLALPVGYGLFRKTQKKQNEKKSKKLELQRILDKLIFVALPDLDKKFDELNKEVEMSGSSKDDLLKIFTNQKRFVEQQIQEIKSKL